MTDGRAVWGHGTMTVMKLMAALIVFTAGAIAWWVDLVPRVQRVLYEYEKHDRFDSSLAFFTGPGVVSSHAVRRGRFGANARTNTSTCVSSIAGTSSGRHSAPSRLS